MRHRRRKCSIAKGRTTQAQRLALGRELYKLSGEQLDRTHKTCADEAAADAARTSRLVELGKAGILLLPAACTAAHPGCLYLKLEVG